MSPDIENGFAVLIDGGEICEDCGWESASSPCRSCRQLSLADMYDDELPED